jgi:hypothetical protein
MMGDEFKGVQYALFPKTIKYKWSKDGAKMTANGITLQVIKTPGITVAGFRADMVGKWQRMTAKLEGLSLGKLLSLLAKKAT